MNITLLVLVLLHQSLEVRSPGAHSAPPAGPPCEESPRPAKKARLEGAEGGVAGWVDSLLI